MAAHSRSTGLVITESFLSPAMARRLVDGWIAPALCNSCDSEVGRDAHPANPVPDLHSSEWRRREGTPRLYQAVHDTSLLTVSINWQTDAIKDQVRNCKELIESKGCIIVEEYIKSDSGLSGATFETREGLQALLQAAKQSPRPLDCIVMDDTSRLARRLAKALSVDELVRYYGISLYFVTQQIDTHEAPSRIAIIFNGMMDEDCIANLAAKVHRGQKGRALEGLIPGGCCGYNNIPIEDHSRRGEYGRPAVIGVRAEINQAEAEVVRRIFDLYGTGTYSLDQIARELNGIPPPKPRNGNLNPSWTATGLFTIFTE